MIIKFAQEWNCFDSMLPGGRKPPGPLGYLNDEFCFLYFVTAPYVTEWFITALQGDLARTFY